MGRATAAALAGAGARLVLASRGPEALQATAAECRALGADVEVVICDVAVPEQVDAVAAAAVSRFGRIDGWVHTASNLVVGPLQRQPVDDIRRLVDTNVFGAALVARAALTQFERQGSGTLVLTSSLLGLVPNPLVPTYGMTKFAIRGLAMSLRHAVHADDAIHVCCVVPGPVDTPIFRAAANHSGREVRAVAPALSPERIAATIVRCLDHPKREVTAGAVSRFVLVGHRLWPRAAEWGVARYAARGIVRNRPSPGTRGALDHGSGTGAVSGGWRRSGTRRRVGDAVGRFSARRAARAAMRRR
jgi:short-subunit dehydrogenase